MISLSTLCISAISIAGVSIWFILTEGTPDPFYMLFLNHWQVYGLLGFLFVLAAILYPQENMTS